MAHSVPDAQLTPLDLLARQQEAIDNLTSAMEYLQGQMESLRRRVQALEGIPVPDQGPADNEPPEPG
jgi:hypothetical protein